jgi:hypothetical protein
MVTSVYQGGLGNLLFQISSGYIFSKNNNTDYKINYKLDKGRGQGNPLSFYKNNIFQNIQETDIIPSYIIEESKFDIEKQIDQKDILLDGFFQKAKYIEKYKNELNTLFNFDSIKLKDKKTKICTIQIRTGDYLHPYYSNFNVITQKYIKYSIDYVLNSFNDIKFYLITDYYYLAKNFLPVNFNVEYYNLSEIDDLKLMSQSDACIISNSTFGWWGSFFGKDKLILAPHIWNKTDKLDEIYTSNMIKIKV